jgi:prolipoprotein diacylglyceryltransferase
MLTNLNDTATGDVFAYPLMIGITIGRIGCFLTRLTDQTYGTPLVVISPALAAHSPMSCRLSVAAIKSGN